MLAIRSTALVRLESVYLLSLLVLFLSGFYLTSVSGSTHASLLRLSLLGGLLYLFFLKKETIFGTLASCFEIEISAYKLLIASLALFFLYIFVSSLYLGDFDVLRRSLVLLAFLFVISFFSAGLTVGFSGLIFFIGVFGFLVGGLYVYEYWGLNDFGFSGYSRERVQSTGFSWLASYDNTITAGLHIAFLCTAALWGVFNAKNKAVAILFYIGFFVLLVAVFLTGARTAWLATIISLCVFFIFEVKKHTVRTLAVYSVLTVLAVIYLFFLYGSDFARGLTYRDQIWIGLLNHLHSTREWLFGMGPAASVSLVKLPDNTYAVHAHNIYVETIYRNGLLGLLLFVSLALSAVWVLIRSAAKEGNVFFIAVMSGGLGAMFFDFSNLIYSPNLMWLWFWFPVAVSLSARKIIS